MTPAERRQIHEAMVRFADGDRGAFRAVFDGLWPTLVSFCRSMHLDDGDAEEAAQRALVKVFARIVDLDRARDGAAWATRIAAFEVMTVRKARARRREDDVAGAAHLVDGGIDPEQRVIAAELDAALRATIGELASWTARRWPSCSTARRHRAVRRPGSVAIER
jgi:DNA-directed RNA polymerase specialized sigma24 family protein